MLKTYLKQAPNARAHLPVGEDTALSEFERVASRYPVFRIAAKSAVEHSAKCPEFPRSLLLGTLVNGPD